MTTHDHVMAHEPCDWSTDRNAIPLGDHGDICKAVRAVSAAPASEGHGAGETA